MDVTAIGEVRFDRINHMVCKSITEQSQSLRKPKKVRRYAHEFVCFARTRQPIVRILWQIVGITTIIECAQELLSTASFISQSPTRCSDDTAAAGLLGRCFNEGEARGRQSMMVVTGTRRALRGTMLVARSPFHSEPSVAVSSRVRRTLTHGVASLNLL